jgi:O-antigen/teichoic acid export membrane protein
MGYTKHAIRGAGWNGALQLATMALSALKVVILARLLSPNDFGLFALVAVTIGTAESFTETGINPTIIQSQKSIGYFLDTAWVISIIRGLLISVVMLLAGFVMQYVYNSQQLFVLIGVASLIPLIKGLINPAIITLQKDFRFFRDSVYRLLVLIIEVVSTITLAVLLHSVYAMVLGIVISALFEVAITWAMFSARPRFNYIRSRAKEIFDNMKGLNISSVLSYLSENADNLIVGKVVGTAGLGVYQNSYGFTHKLNLQLAKSVQIGTFPVYARIKEDQARLRRAYLKTVTTALGTFTLIALPFFFFPQPTVDILLGSKWQAAVPLIRPLLLAGLIQSVVAMSSSLLVARKAYFWLNTNLFISVSTMITFVSFFGAQYGLMGAVLGVVAARALALPVVLFGVYQSLRHSDAVKPARAWQ